MLDTCSYLHNVNSSEIDYFLQRKNKEEFKIHVDPLAKMVAFSHKKLL